MLLNPFFSYHFGDGWALTSSPQITANWIATGDKWTVPVGGGVSKVLRIGELPLKFEVAALQRGPANREPRPLAILGHIDFRLFRATCSTGPNEGTLIRTLCPL